MHVIKCKMQVRILHALYLNHLQQLQCLQYYRLGYHSQCQQLLFCYFIIASLSLSISIETWSTPQSTCTISRISSLSFSYGYCHIVCYILVLCLLLYLLWNGHLLSPLVLFSVFSYPCC